MNLFIANVSDQDHIFYWREGENPQIFKTDIKTGQQIQVIRDKPPEIVRSVIDHHARYGMKSFEELKAHNFEGDMLRLVYSLDEHLPPEVYGIAQEINDEIRRRQVQLAKEKTAYAFAKTAEQDQTGLFEGVNEIGIDIEEQAPKELALKDKKLINQTFKTKIKK